MIVKRLEKNGKIKAMYSSSTICGSVYDTTTKDLTVIFNNGGQYKYPNVESTDYMRLETADSNGSTFNTYIKKKYVNFEKLDKLSESAIAAILKEVGELKASEDNVSIDVRAKIMLETMNLLIGAYLASGKVDLDLFRKVHDNVVSYDKLANPQPVQAND